jgi:spermidine/putrescine transport system substrate-binding protein
MMKKQSKSPRSCLSHIFVMENHFHEERYAVAKKRGRALGMPFRILFLAILVLGGLTGCTSNNIPADPTLTPPLAKELILYNWADYMPQSVLDAFTAEYGVEVTYLTYESQEEAATQLRDGENYDVVVLELDLIPPLAADGLLAKINYQNVPNFKNISPNFRDLTFDPGNAHSVPYGYGTTGLVVRSDLIDAPVTRWADLWNSRYAGRIAARALPGELIGVALKSLGYPLGSEDPQQLEAALQRLLDLSPIFVDNETENAIPTLLSGEAVIMVGWANDAQQAKEENESITYVLPEEGTLLWGDAFVIPANSTRKYTAEVFLNFLLRPEISAQIVNENHYATANEAAYPLIDPGILNDQLIFPPVGVFKKEDWYLPLSPAGEKSYARIWERFLAGQP